MFARFIAFILALPLAGQEPAFDVQSRLVQVPVLVTDANGESLDGLEPSDFVLLDNGKPRRVDVDTFGTGVAPIALVFAIQSSGISDPALDKIRKIGSMIQPLITGERGRGAVVTFDEQVRWIQDFTSNGDKLKNALYRIQPGGAEKQARMLDACLDAIERLKARPKVRRVLVLLSESRDRNSETSLESVVLEAQKAGVTIYAATYSAFKTAFTQKASEAHRKPKPQGPPIVNGVPNPINYPPLSPTARVDLLGVFGELFRLGKAKSTDVLAGATGGTTFSFSSYKGLEEVIDKLGRSLHAEYLLSFDPKDAEPGYHKLEVRVNRPGPLIIRGRPGYWAAESVPQ